jgi:hypothetical protein
MNFVRAKNECLDFGQGDSFTAPEAAVEAISGKNVFFSAHLPCNLT